MEEFQNIIAQFHRKEITEETCVHEILALLDNRGRYGYRSFEFLTEIASCNDNVFKSVLTSVFDNVPLYKQMGPYPYNYFFGGANRFLLSICETDRRSFIETFAAHKEAHVRALVGDCLMEWGQPESFSLIEEALIADSADDSDTQENILMRLGQVLGESLGLLKKSYSQENIASLYNKRVQSPLSGAQIQALSQVVRKSTNLARLTLVGACKKLKDARLVPVLIELLDDHDSPQHKWANFDPMCYYAASSLEHIDTAEAHQALERWREKEFQFLKKQMQSPHRYTSSSAYYYAAKLGDVRFIALLAEEVRNIVDVEQEYYALSALAKFHHDETIAALIEFIQAWGSKKRTHEEHKVIPTLAFILSQHRGYRTLWEAIKALGELKAENAVSMIVYALSLDHHPDEWQETCQVGVQALRSIGTDEAMEALKKFECL